MALFVSALFDVARSEGSSGRRSVKEYLALAPALIASNVDLHIFVEEHLYDDVVALTVNRPAELLTIIEPMRIQDAEVGTFSEVENWSGCGGDSPNLINLEFCERHCNCVFGVVVKT